MLFSTSIFCSMAGIGRRWKNPSCFATEFGKRYHERDCLGRKIVSLLRLCKSKANSSSAHLFPKTWHLYFQAAWATHFGPQSASAIFSTSLDTGVGDLSLSPGKVPEGASSEKSSFTTLITLKKTVFITNPERETSALDKYSDGL